MVDAITKQTEFTISTTEDDCQAGTRHALNYPHADLCMGSSFMLTDVFCCMYKTAVKTTAACMGPNFLPEWSLAMALKGSEVTVRPAQTSGAVSEATTWHVPRTSNLSHAQRL